jgi:hypothetical protein
MKTKIELDGNVYSIREVEVEGEKAFKIFKPHGAGEKEVTNPNRIKQILDLAKAE